MRKINDKESLEIVGKFLEKDSIDLIKFKVNFDHYHRGRFRFSKTTLVEYHEPTPSCFSLMNLPMGYPYWFASAYPDVVRCLSELPDIEIALTFKEMGFLKEEEKLDDPKIESKIMDQKREYYNLGFLYKLKEYYKKTYPNKRLECQ